jgi:hypothetical protein
MIDLEPIVADYAPRPKRKYTVTERVLAACRESGPRQCRPARNPLSLHRKAAGWRPDG